MTGRRTTVRDGSESGFALILALLALMLLTFLGLTLATTTSTELQIASNYRWAQQAYYNAEAGIELGKRFLRQNEWQIVLPGARATDASYNFTAAPPAQLTRTGPSGEPSRNFESAGCDPYLQGYGAVLDTPNLAYPLQNTSQFLGESINGSFTLWVRRPLSYDANGNLIGDATDFNTLILTAEGTAPDISPTIRTQRAVRYMQVTLKRIEANDCENRSSQAGSGPSGAGYDQCDAVNAAGILGGVTEANAGAQ